MPLSSAAKCVVSCRRTLLLAGGKDGRVSVLLWESGLYKSPFIKSCEFPFMFSLKKAIYINHNSEHAPCFNCWRKPVRGSNFDINLPFRSQQGQIHGPSVADGWSGAASSIATDGRTGRPTQQVLESRDNLSMPQSLHAPEQLAYVFLQGSRNTPFVVIQLHAEAFDHCWPIRKLTLWFPPDSMTLSKFGEFILLPKVWTVDYYKRVQNIHQR